MTRRGSVVEMLPLELYVEVTNRCNSLCDACVRTHMQREPLRDMTMPEFRSLVDQFPVLDRVALHGIGEPLLNCQSGSDDTLPEGRPSLGTRAFQLQCSAPR